MKTLHKYVLAEFLKLLVLTMLAFIAIFLLVDFVEKINDLMKHNVPIIEAIKYFVFKVPSILSLMSPIAVLLAVLLSLGMLSKHTEITAIKAAGIGLIRLITPLLICGALISIAIIIVNEAVVPAANGKVLEIETKWLDKKPEGSFGRGGFWLKDESGIYNIRELKLELGLIRGVTFYELSNGFAPKRRFHADSATWNEQTGQWVATRGRRQSFREEIPTEDTYIKNFALPSLKGPTELISVTDHEQMSFAELKRYIQGLESQGYDTTKYLVDMYGKVSFPLVNFIMVLVGIPFALRSGRRGGIADGVAISVAIGFSFWVVFALTRSLGHSGILPPIVAAGFPDVLFLSIGILMLGYVRQ